MTSASLSCYHCCVYFNTWLGNDRSFVIGIDNLTFNLDFLISIVGREMADLR